MRMPVGRRIALGAALAVGLALGPTLGTAADLRGEVTLSDGGRIPKGVVEVYVDDPSASDELAQAAPATRLASDGTSRRMAFTLAAPAPAATSSPLEVVAVLERPDGWLIARGSTPLAGDGPVTVTLHPAMY